MEDMDLVDQLQLFVCQREQMLNLVKDIDEQLNYFNMQKKDALAALEKLDSDIASIKAELKAQKPVRSRRPQKPNFAASRPAPRAPRGGNQQGRNRPNPHAKAPAAAPQEAAAAPPQETATVSSSALPANCKFVFKVPKGDEFLEVYICDGDDVSEVIGKFVKENDISEEMHQLVLAKALETVKASKEEAAQAPKDDSAKKGKGAGRNRKQWKQRANRGKRPQREAKEEPAAAADAPQETSSAEPSAEPSTESSTEPSTEPVKDEANPSAEPVKKTEESSNAAEPETKPEQEAVPKNDGESEESKPAASE